MKLDPFLIALQFLTRIPVRKPLDFSPENQSRSLLYYPLVGGLIGLVLLAFVWLFSSASVVLVAIGTVVLWVLLTGGLHLDGLADSVDAWAGGFGDRERTLEIMKDPACGPAGVVALVLLLMGKGGAVFVLLQGQHYWAILFAPVLGRAAALGLMAALPYVRADGIAASMMERLPVDLMAWVIAGTGLAVLLVFGWTGVFPLLILVLGVWAAGRLMRQRIGGATGDTLGAVVELAELLVLLIF